MRHGIFLLIDPPTPEDAAATRAVVDAHSFPWEWTVHRNIRETGQAILPIGFRDYDGSYGFYTQGLNRIDIDPVATQGAAGLGRTLAHELGHLIDDTCLTGDTRRQIHALMHTDSPIPLGECPAGTYWRGGGSHSRRPNEAFANLAPHIWCPLHAKPSDRYGPHVFTRLNDIEELVMADAVKTPPFDDIAGTEHENDILWAAREGIAFGRGGLFHPNAPVSRGQMCAFLRRALDDEEPSRG